MIAKEKLLSICAVGIITVAGGTMIGSMWDDSPSADEVENITAGYYYVTTQQFWLNHYQPPLVKDVAGLVVAATNPKPFTDSWQWRYHRRAIRDVFFWGQNNAQSMLRLARLPMIAISIAFLLYFYFRIKREFGGTPAIIALTMLAFSPTYLAHSRFVTTDAAATAGFFISIFAFLDYQRKPTIGRIVIASIFTGLSLLVKFSLIYLLPLFGFLSLTWHLTLPTTDATSSVKTRLKRLLIDVGLLLFITCGIVWVAYFIHMYNLMPDYTLWYINKHLKRFMDDPRVILIVALRQTMLGRPFAWYLAGLFGQYIHLHAGHSPYSFLNDSYKLGGRIYFFPLLLLTKEPLGFVILTLTSAAASIQANAKQVGFKADSIRSYINQNFVVLSSLFFVMSYLAIGMRFNLNIGVRHVLPIVPFLYMLTAIALTRYILPHRQLNWIVALLLFYGCASSLSAYPGYLAYYNELGGGKAHGMHISVDSNYDWGVDLLRLKKYVEENKLPRIYVLYYGTGDPNYYLGDRAIIWTQNTKVPSGAYLAVSVTIATKAAATLKVMEEPRLEKLNFGGKNEVEASMLRWFSSLKPIAQAGDSILIYKVP
ncbi:MAG: glycosyltransferase family 39 protein [Candidatus Obscuribacterales bacterium]|nr:glycosyltransferase family 39 protein [Candidatus Obscuribacterales bacterium]